MKNSEWTISMQKGGIGLAFFASICFGLWQYNIFAGLFMFAIIMTFVFILDEFKHG